MKVTEHLKCKGKYALLVLVFFAVCVWPLGFIQAADYKVSTTEIAYPAKDVAIKFMTRVYEELGHRMVIQEYPQGRALIESNAGHADGELFRVAGINSEYKNLIQIPGPISFSQIYAYVSKASNLTPAKWSDLKDLRVGYVVGAKIVETKLQGIQSIAVQRPEQLFLMLENNRLDVAINAATSAKVPEGVTLVNPPLLKTPVYHYLHVKNKQLVVPLQASIQRLTELGVLDDIISSSRESVHPRSIPGK